MMMVHNIIAVQALFAVCAFEKDSHHVKCTADTTRIF